MVLLKLYAACSCFIGLVQIVAGIVAASSMHDYARVGKLFDNFALLGAFGPIELLWFGVSTLVAALFARRGYSFLPPLVFIVFCLVHPTFHSIFPESSFTMFGRVYPDGSASLIAESCFGIIYLLTTFVCYQKDFFLPELFEER
jgi:hypothetical protein